MYPNMSARCVRQPPGELAGEPEEVAEAVPFPDAANPLVEHPFLRRLIHPRVRLICGEYCMQLLIQRGAFLQVELAPALLDQPIRLGAFVVDMVVAARRCLR